MAQNIGYVDGTPDSVIDYANTVAENTSYTVLGTDPHLGDLAWLLLDDVPVTINGVDVTGELDVNVREDGIDIQWFEFWLPEDDDRRDAVEDVVGRRIANEDGRLLYEHRFTEAELGDVGDVLRECHAAVFE